MRSLLAATALTLAFGSPALAFDGATEGIIARHKANKPVSISDIATLMGSSERWCYAEDAGTCSWSDIYLDVTDTGATFEIGNAWSADADIVFTDQGVFKDGRYICETGDNWVPTVRATRRSDGSPIGGRELWTLKQEIESGRGEVVIDCFDYLFVSSDTANQTITLLQRQYTDDAHIAENDVEVTLHFDATDAAALTWRW